MEKRENVIDLHDMIKILRKNFMYIIISGVLLALIFGVATILLIKPKYQSNTKSLVINQQDSKALTYSDFQSSTQFIEDYKEIVCSRSILQSVIENLKLTESLEELEDMLDVSIVNETHHLKITVTTDNPEKSQKIAEEITVTASEMFEDIMNISAVKIIDHANFPEKKSSPNIKMNILLGLVAGVMLGAIVILTRYLLDNRINTAEDFASQFGYPALATIPYDSAINRSGKRRKKK